MRAIYKYNLIKRYRSLSGYLYRGLKKVVRFFSYYHNYLGCTLEALRLETLIPVTGKIKRMQDEKEYKRKWRALSSHIPSVFIRMYPSYSGLKSADYVPDSLFYTHIEPMLNNREFARTFADKNLYALLFGKGIQPLVWLRKIHGTYLGSDLEKVINVDAMLSDLALRFKQVLVKPSIESQGGRSVALLRSMNGSLWIDGEKVTENWLDMHYKDYFLIQEAVRQHSFYEAFNPTSVNTLRITTYRSVIDESVHVLHGLLRVGSEGSVVDNVSAGGMACGISPDGTLNGKVIDYRGKSHSKAGSVELKAGLKLLKYKEVLEHARQLATKQLYARFNGFDFCVDENEEIILIEINNYDVGINTLQFCNGPLFGKFTDEVLDFCVKQKKGFRYQIR